MVLPLLFSLGLPALAAAAPAGGVLAGLGATLGTAGMAGLGAGLGSFLQSGDLGEGIKTGLTSFLGGKILGGLTGSTSANALNASQGIQTEAFGELAQPKLLQAFPNLTEQGGLFASEGMKRAAAGAFAPGVMPAAFMGQTMADAYEMDRAAKKDEDDSNPPPMPRPPIRTYNPNPYGGGNTGEGLYFQYQRPPAPEGYQPQYPYYYAEGGLVDLGEQQRMLRDTPMQAMGGHPMFSNLGRQLAGAVTSHYGQKVPPFIKKIEQDARSEFGDDIFVQQATQVPTLGGNKGAQVTNPTQIDQRKINLYDLLGRQNSPFRDTVVEMAKGGEVEVDDMIEANGMNEKDVIVKAIEAIKGMSEQPEIDLALFVQKYGEEALRDLVGRVQSGELDDTVARFENGDKGMVRGPGDGSGVDDMVPATLEGEQDVLLSDGEYVLRKNTTDALEKAYGGGFLDIVNRAEEDAPRQLEQMVG
jgi:hypothetical protein